MMRAAPTEPLGATNPQDARADLLPRATSESRTPACKLAACCANFCLDVATVFLLIIILPIVLCILAIFCTLPLIERLIHPRREYLDGVAASFVNALDEGIIHAVIISKRPVTASSFFDRFKATYIASERPELARFQQRIVRRQWFWAYWDGERQQLDESYHFRCHSERITKEGMEAAVAAMQSDMLDLERPPWQVCHYENYIDESGQECSATVLRIHHAMADGFTALRLVLHGSEPNKPPAENASERPSRSKPPGWCTCFQMFLFWLAAMRKLLFMREDRVSVFKASAPVSPTGAKNFAWNSLGTSVADLKALGRSLGGATINDILLSSLNGALRQYATRESQANAPDTVTATMWVSLSPLRNVYKSFDEVPFKWGNSTLGAVYLPFSMNSLPGAVESLGDMRKLTAGGGTAVEAGVATFSLKLLGLLPRAVLTGIWPALCDKVSISMSNVPGPQFAMEWCGVPIRGTLFCVPPTGRISNFVTIVTFDGDVSIGMSSDSNVLSKEALQEITGSLFASEIKALQKAAGLHV